MAFNFEDKMLVTADDIQVGANEVIGDEMTDKERIDAEVRTIILMQCVPSELDNLQREFLWEKYKNRLRTENELCAEKQMDAVGGFDQSQCDTEMKEEENAGREMEHDFAMADVQPENCSDEMEDLQAIERMSDEEENEEEWMSRVAAQLDFSPTTSSSTMSDHLERLDL